jgi:hypothetical protein
MIRTQAHGTAVVGVAALRCPHDHQRWQRGVGARALREWLADLEVEAGIQARATGVTVRQMSAATGIADRNVRLRYRREDADTASGNENG